MALHAKTKSALRPELDLRPSGGTIGRYGSDYEIQKDVCFVCQTDGSDRDIISDGVMKGICNRCHWRRQNPLKALRRAILAVLIANHPSVAEGLADLMLAALEGGMKR